MITKYKKLFFCLLVFMMLTSLIFLMACKSPASPDEDEVAIIGCDKVKYKGCTYTISGCEQSGVTGFSVTISNSCGTASFRITCSGGCINTATPQ